MMVHRKKRPRYEMQAPLTPLIDIVFMLLIYFLLTTNFITESGIDINLPESQASATQTEEEITVHLDGDGGIYLGDRPVPFNDLFDRLRARIRSRPDALVVIKADRSIDLESAVNVMDIAKTAGAGRLFLATEKRPRPADG